MHKYKIFVINKLKLLKSSVDKRTLLLLGAYEIMLWLVVVLCFGVVVAVVVIIAFVARLPVECRAWVWVWACSVLYCQFDAVLCNEIN